MFVLSKRKQRREDGFTDGFAGIRNTESNNEVMFYTTCLNCIDINVWLPGAIA